MNPILPLQQFIPDAEARVWSDGRLYLYGSRDLCGDPDYCSHDHRVFSTDNLRDWTDHGECFHARDSHTGSGPRLYAPDCIHAGGMYRLLYCCSDKSEGVACSDHPAGPFRDARAMPVADKDGIDPAALVDDDGSVYYFWGQIRLRGARLLPDLSGPDPSTLQTSLLTEAADGFHEGASIRKRNGLYYMVYADISRGRPTCLGYATSRSPLGPYEKQGIIIDNLGCDPSSWNNHGSIAEFNGQWYVFYHRSSQNSRVNRRVCVEPIHFDDAGRIAEVEMTTQGAEGPLDPRRPLEACRACLLGGAVHIVAEAPGRECLAHARPGDWAAYKYFNFSVPCVRLHLEASPGTEPARLEARLDAPDGPALGSLDIPAGSGTRVVELRCPLDRAPAGVHALYLVFGGPGAESLRARRLWFS